MSARPDHLVIGAGHNGLICAIELARRGRSVLVLEAADQVGGAAVTREFASGFRVSPAAHLLQGLPAGLIRDYALERHGLRFAAQDLPTVALQEGAPPIVLSGGAVAGVAEADARAYADFHRRMGRFARVVQALHATVPFGPGLASGSQRRDAALLALRMRLLGRRDMREILRIGAMNAYDLFTEHFASPGLQGALAFDACLGAEYAARSPGTVLTLLHRWAALQQAGALGLALPAGGLGAVTAALAAAARAAGVQIRTGARVQRVLVEADRASGVRLDSGESIAAGSVISNADPRTTFLRLVGAEHLDTDFVRRVDHHRARGLVAKLHLALEGAPAVPGLAPAQLGGRLLISPTMDYLERAFNPSKYRQVPQEPALEIIVPTVHDGELAPAGRHVLSAQVMFVPYDLGADPAAAREQLQASVMRVLERHMPGLGRQVLATELLTPADLEREFGMAGGHWHHGALGFDQFFFTRPVVGATRYATPLPGLYLCGAGSHPGGGVTGQPGRNAARVILQEGR